MSAKKQRSSKNGYGSLPPESPVLREVLNELYAEKLDVVGQRCVEAIEGHIDEGRRAAQLPLHDFDLRS